MPSGHDLLGYDLGPTTANQPEELFDTPHVVIGRSFATPFVPDSSTALLTCVHGYAPIVLRVRTEPAVGALYLTPRNDLGYEF